MSGLLGALLSDPTRVVLGTALGAVGAGLGIAGVAGGVRRPLQCDRETPKAWVDRGPVLWPALNGVALGVGATTRLGFWLWYSIPAGCVLLASPAAGAAIWGTYGCVRTGSAGAIWLVGVVRPDADRMSLLSRHDAATVATAALTMLLGLATFLLMGL